MGAAEILDECIHGMTRAWCSLCKEKPRTKSKRERMWHRAAIGSRMPDYPHTLASFSSSCPWCGERIEEGEDEVFLINEEDWVCRTCALEYDAGDDDSTS